MKKEKVLVVGGGFAGVKVALELSEDEHFDVTLLSNQSDFRYYPTLYRTATGGKRASSSVPLPVIFEGKKVAVIQGEAKTLDRKARTVTTQDETLPYDTLVLALGVVTNYFGIPGLAENAYSVKSTEEALRFKNSIHQDCLDGKLDEKNYMIVGGGPTGIELAGSLPAYVRHVMTNHGIKQKTVNVRLVEAAPRLLPRLPKHTSTRVRNRLKKLGVKIELGKVVQGQTADDLTVSGKPIKTHTVVWTAGVTNHPFFKDNGFILMPRGKVATDIYLQTEDNIFVAGDNANTPYSGLAQTAVRDGAFIASNLKCRVRGRTMKPYRPMTPTTVIPVGERWAAVNFKNFRLYGIVGYLLRNAADFIAFKDIESWPKATVQWSQDLGEEETCDVCKTSTVRQ